MAAEKPSSKGQAWFCTSGLPSDVLIKVDDMTFHLHKFPLVSKSRKLHQLISEQETNSSSTAKILAPLPPTSSATAATAVAELTQKQQRQENREKEGHDTEEEKVEERDGNCHISLENFPGGSQTFEMAVKFCYGVKIDLSAANVAPLRCAGEFLEMTEEYSPENLIGKTERFFSQSVFKSLRESVRALRSCESVSQISEALGITQRCIDSIASRASSADPALFGWPVRRGGSGEGAAEAETGLQMKSLSTDAKTESWFDDLTQLSLGLFNRLILAMRSQDINPEVIESFLMHYAKKHIPGISRSNRKPPPSSSSTASENQQKQLLETIIANLPSEKSSRSSTNTRFLFGLLRTAKILNASEASSETLEKIIGLQLEQATLDDLLIPSYSYLNETLYDVDCVDRILGCFLDKLEEENNAAGIETEGGGGGGEGGGRYPALMLVAKLIDGYLAEIASDSNLKPDRFYDLAVSLPDQARLFEDGLYRAVDIYLKAHSWLTEAEREKICGVMDFQKLTLEACTHAAQNERLPLRAVVQVLFFEQLHLRHAIAGTLLATSPSTEPDRESAARPEPQPEPKADGDWGNAEEEEEGSKWKKTLSENQVLRTDVDSMRTRVHRLEREYSDMKRVIAKIEKAGPTGGASVKGWSLTKRFGCKFRTQVCNSHEATTVDSRKGRNQ